jgi:tellurite resistance protein TerC
MPIKKALKWVAFWVSLALLFNLCLYFVLPLIEKGVDGGQKALEFLGGYVLEFSLSLDNMFVFLLIFTSFNVPARLQRRALNYGIAGAVILRFAFIMLGAALVSRFEWILYIFGGVLIISGAMMFFKEEKEKDYKQSRLLSHIDRVIPFTGKLEGEKFFVRRDGRLYATLLFAVLLIIETSDIIFAVDSIPAIFSVVPASEKFIIYSSNIFAILGLRSLYFVIEKLTEMFRLVKYGVAFILIFTGVKLAILIFHVEIPILLSIGIIASILLVSIVASTVFKDRAHSHID